MMIHEESVDVVAAYQALEKSTGAEKLKFLEAKIQLQGELQERGYSLDQARNLAKALPASLAFREFHGGLSVRLSVSEAVDEVLAHPLARQVLGLSQIEKEAEFIASLAKLPPAERINAARKAGIRL